MQRRSIVYLWFESTYNYYAFVESLIIGARNGSMKIGNAYFYLEFDIFDCSTDKGHVGTLSHFPCQEIFISVIKRPTYSVIFAVLINLKQSILLRLYCSFTMQKRNLNMGSIKLWLNWLLKRPFNINNKNLGAQPSMKQILTSMSYKVF